jgi:hypothetical protein
VAFDDNFWVATSAAAPVIALAAVVALPDVRALLDTATDNYFRLELKAIAEPVPIPHSERDGIPGPPDPPPHDPFGFALADSLIPTVSALRFRSEVLLRLTVINLIIQAGLLAVSLSALAVGQNVMPPPAAIVLAAGGILLLATTTAAATNYRRLLTKVLAGDPFTPPLMRAGPHKKRRS